MVASSYTSFKFILNILNVQELTDCQKRLKGLYLPPPLFLNLSQALDGNTSTTLIPQIVAIWCYVLWTLLEGPPSSSQMNHTQKLIIMYKHLSLAWPIYFPPYLYFHIYYLASVFFPFPYFFYHILTPWIAMQVGNWPLLSSSFSGSYSEPLLPVFYFSVFALPARPAYSFPCLATDCSDLY